MHFTVPTLMRSATTLTAALAMAAISSMPAARADETQAKQLFKSMSDQAQQTCLDAY